MDTRSDRLILALARGASAVEAARVSGYCAKTVYRRRRNRAFMQKVAPF